MKRLQMILGIMVVLFLLISCVSATPKINLIKASGLAMEIDREAPWVTAVAISSNGKLALSGGTLNNNVRLWDISTGKELQQFIGHKGFIRSLAFSPDGKSVASGSNDSTIRLWNVENGLQISQFDGYSRLVNQVLFTTDGKHILSTGLDSLSPGMLKLWDIATGKEIIKFHENVKGLKPIAMSSNGRYVLSAGSQLPQKDVRIWDYSTGELIKKIKRPGPFGLENYMSIAISRDNKLVASNSELDRIRIWDISSGEEIRTFRHPGILGGAYAMTFTPDGQYIVSAGGEDAIIFWDIYSGKELKRLIGHSGYVYSIAFSSDGRYLLSGSGDGSIRLWDMRTNQEVAVMIDFENDEWIAITREGYYNASEKGAQYLKVKFADKDYTIDQFYDVFYRPDIVAAKLRGEDISGLVTITMKDAIKNPPPVAEFTSKISDTDQPRTRVCYQVKSTGGGIGEVRLFHNGKLIQSDGYYKDMAKSTSDKTQLAALNSKTIYEDMRSISVKGKVDTVPTSLKPKGDVFEDCREVEAIPGQNDLSVSAFNSGNTVQSYMKTTSFNSKLTPEDPHLYILAIGIDQYKETNVNLKYAVKDAKDIEEKLKTQAATLYKAQNIHYEILTDGGATKANITDRINELTQKIKPQDSFILFVAGHGVLLQNQYYLLTHDYNGNVSESSMISSNEIVEMSKKIKSLSQLFIFDTCHAGGVDTIVSGLYDARMSVLAKKMGLHIYASASDKQTAMDGYKGNGLFTYTLLDGLNNNKEADRNKDGKVTVVGLGEYSKRKTTDISREIGHSQTPIIINFGKDSPIYKLQ